MAINMLMSITRRALRRKKWLVFAGTIAIFVAAVMIRTTRSQERLYGGRSAQFWLDQAVDVQASRAKDNWIVEEVRRRFPSISSKPPVNYRWSLMAGFCAVSDHVLVDMLEDPDPQVRALTAFAFVGRSPLSANAVCALLKCAGDSDFRVRREAGEALINSSAWTPAISGILVKLLNDKHRNVRVSVSAGIVERPDRAQSLMPELRRALRDTNASSELADTLATLEDAIKRREAQK